MDDTQNTSPALTGDEIRKIAREEIVRFVDMILDNRNYSESLEQCIEWAAESLDGKD